MKLQYKFPKTSYAEPEDPEKVLGEDWAKRIFESVLVNILGSVYEGRLAGKDARCCNRVLSALDATKTEYITIETAELEFLRTHFTHDRCAVSPTQVRAFCLYQDAIDLAIRNALPAEASAEVLTAPKG